MITLALSISTHSWVVGNDLRGVNGPSRTPPQGRELHDQESLTQKFATFVLHCVDVKDAAAAEDEMGAKKTITDIIGQSVLSDVGCHLQRRNCSPCQDAIYLPTIVAHLTIQAMLNQEHTHLPDTA